MSRRALRSPFAALVFAALVAGIWWRTAGLEQKIYWHDEVATRLSLAGRTVREVRALPHHTPLNAATLARDFQDPARGTLDTALRALVEDEPQSSPLYLVLAHMASQAFGQVGPRVVSLLCGLALMAVAGWLAAELFANSRAGWIAATLVAMSPMHVRYAQEARSYALWGLAVALSTLLLLRATRRGRPIDVLAFGLAAAVAIYAHLFSIFVLCAQAAWLLWTRTDWRDSVKWRPWWGVALALVLVMPWAVVLAMHWDTAAAHTAWTLERLQMTTMASRWAGILTTVFVRPTGSLARVAAAAGIVVLLAAAGRALAAAPRGAAALVLLLGGVPALGLIAADVILGGHPSAIPRYWGPTWLAAELAVAWLLARATPGRTFVLAALLAAGGASVAASARLQTWWDTNPPVLLATLEAAAAANRSPRPVVSTGAHPFALLVLVNELRSDATVLLSADDPSAR